LNFAKGTIRNLTLAFGSEIILPMVKALALLIGALIFSPLLAHADCSKVIVSGDPEYQPFAWYDGQNMHGASIEIVTEILNQMHIPFEVKYSGPFLRVLKSAELGQIDIISELKNTEDRRAYLQFTETAIFSNPVAAFTLPHRKISYSKWEDLKGWRGGITVGNKFGGGLDKFIEAHLNVSSASKIRANFDKLSLGRIDYFINSYYPAMVDLISHNEETKFTVLKPFLTSNENFVGWSKNSPCIGRLKEFDTLLAGMVQTGQVEKILNSSLEQLRQRAQSQIPMPSTSKKRGK
jgi:polar amino acid transport system substrate-binding protein